MDIEIINTPDKPITGIRKRMISNDIQKVDSGFRALLNVFMKADKKTYYKNKQMLIDLIEKTIEVAFIEGQRTGTETIKYVGVENEKRAEEVYPEASGTSIGSLKD